MATEPDLSALAQARFEALAGAWAEARAAAEAKVTTWEWATGPLHEALPLAIERSELKRGRRLREPPATPDGAYEYGFDERRRLSVIREHVDRSRAYEEFFAYRDDGFERARFDYSSEHRLLAVTECAVQGARVVKTATHAVEGSSTELYEYRGARPIAVAVNQRSHDGQEAPYDVAVEYDELGVLGRVQHVYPNGYARTVFRRPASRPTLASLSAVVRERLIESVPELVGCLALEEPAFAVLLVSDAEDGGSLPPLLAVGLASERAAWLREHGTRAREHAWNPASYRHFDVPALTFDAPELLAAGQLLGELFRSRASPERSVRKLLDEVAADLNRAAWPPHFPRTDDFVVFATDLEGTDAARALRVAAAPAERVEQLRRQGLV
ncbi:MAG: hypothetical protein OZ921_01800 [Sorangiineae bacterium]|nr:hypothetical protein [Polyangiaceae bacterium]MEB2321217.1 hypothetical protein [Sorangiineae bacterium]